MAEQSTGLAKAGSTRTTDSIGDFGRKPAERWLKLLDKAKDDKKYKTFLDNAKAIFKRYRDERDAEEQGKIVVAGNDRSPRFNILWSSMQITLPAYFGQAPKPVVKRRFRSDNDANAIAAAEVLERTAEYLIDEQKLDRTVKRAVFDFALAGMGTARVLYRPYMNSDGAIDYETVEWEHVLYRNLRWQPCDQWANCGWIAIRYRKTKKQLEELRASTEAEEDRTKPLHGIGGDPTDEGDHDDNASPVATYEAWQIWDKTSRRVMWVAPTVDSENFISVGGDPYKLDGFFPIPEPMLATTTTDTMVPVADFYEWQDQAITIDWLTVRIDNLTQALRVAGAYDKGFPELAGLINNGATDNILLPVDGWRKLQEKGGLEGVMDFLPNDKVAEVLKAAVELRKLAKEDAYEISGVSDILRGASDPNETLGAQELKSRFANLRLSSRQDVVSTFCRDLVSLAVEIAAEMFKPETLQIMTGLNYPMTLPPPSPMMGHNGGPPMQMPQGQPAMQQPGQQPGQPPAMQMPPQGQTPGMPPMQPGAIAPAPQQAPDPAAQQAGSSGVAPRAPATWDGIMKLLRNNAVRRFNIDIETDSTIAKDEEADKRAVGELMKALSDFFGVMMQIAPQAPSLIPVFAEIVMQAVRTFKPGRSIEEEMEQAMLALQEQAKQAQANPQPSADDKQLAFEQQKHADEMALEGKKLDIEAREAAAKAQEDANAAVLGSPEGAGLVAALQQAVQATQGQAQQTAAGLQQLAQMIGQQNAEIARAIGTLGQQVNAGLQTVIDQQGAQAQQVIAAIEQPRQKHVTVQRGEGGKITGATVTEQ